MLHPFFSIEIEAGFWWEMRHAHSDYAFLVHDMEGAVVSCVLGSESNGPEGAGLLWLI